MKDFGYGTQHALRAHGVISDLAPGGGAAFSILSGSSTAPRGARAPFEHNCPRLCTLEAVKLGLTRLLAECAPGDRIVIETSWGSQLPLFSTEMRAGKTARALVQDVSNLIHKLRSINTQVSFTGTAADPDPVLVRQASRALMEHRNAIAS